MVCHASSEITTAGPHQRMPTLWADQRGTTSLEWALLLGAIAIPSYFFFELALATMIGFYQMMTPVNGLPFP